MEISPPPGMAERVEEREDRFAFIRIAGAGAGLLLVLAGAWLSIVLFIEIYNTFKEPKTFGDRLDKWEQVIRGRAIMLDAATEDSPVGFRTPADPEGQYETISIARPVAEVLALTARPMAAGIMILIVLILIRIAIALIQAGGGLMNLSVSEKELLRKLVAEIRKTR